MRMIFHNAAFSLTRTASIAASLAAGLATSLAFAGAARAADARFVRSPTVGCYDRTLMQQARDLRDDDQVGQARDVLADGLAAGACRTIAPGVLVRVEDGDILANLSKVRAGGEPGALWVRSEALSDD